MPVHISILSATSNDDQRGPSGYPYVMNRVLEEPRRLSRWEDERLSDILQYLEEPRRLGTCGQRSTYIRYMNNKLTSVDGKMND